jgi:type II secretory pathway component PulF
VSQTTFRYKALDRRGARTRGEVRAADQVEAYRQITAAGLRPLAVAARRGGIGRRARRVTAKDVAHFSYQFAVLMEARISIGDGLRAVADQEPNARFREAITDIARQIESGCSVTDAFHPHRRIFGDVYVETIRAAEVSGNMVAVLHRLAEMLDQQYETTKNVKGALMYPLCVVCALGLAVTFLIIVVVPKFASMFASRGIELPLPTQLLMAFAGFCRTYWYLLLGAGAGGAFALRAAWRNPRSRRSIDRWMHRVPFLRSVLTGLAVSRFAHVFGLSIQSGLNLMEALQMAGRASGRPMLEADAEKMRDQVNHGGRLADVLLACVYLPGFARRMIAAGEEAAELSRMCGIVARHYDREVAHLTRNVTTVIEPIMIVGLAAVVLIVALAIFLPMWNMAALIG